MGSTSITTPKFKDTTPKSELNGRNCITDIKKPSVSNLNNQVHDQTILFQVNEVEKRTTVIHVPDTIRNDDTEADKEAPKKITIIPDTLRIDDTIPLPDTEPFNEAQENNNHLKIPLVRNKIKFFKYGKVSKPCVSNKSDATTNTTLIEKSDVSTQTISFDEMFQEYFDLEKIESTVINQIYTEFEGNIIDNILNDYLDMVFKSSNKNKKMPKTPKSPSILNGVTVINDSLEEEQQDDAANSSTSVARTYEHKKAEQQVKAFNQENFNDLLNSSRTSKGNFSTPRTVGVSKKEQRKMPCLEFLSASAKNSKENLDSPKRDTVTTTPLKEITNFIVTDTPDKEEESKKDDLLSEGLSRSASRMEAVNARSFIFNKENNSIVKYNQNTTLDETANTSQMEANSSNIRSAPFQKSQIADGTPNVNTNSNYIEPTFILENNDNNTEAQPNIAAEENKSKKYFLKKAPIIANHSLLLNSINEPSPSLTTNAENLPRYPPNANDILGDSYNVGENTLSTTIAATTITSLCVDNKIKIQEEQTSTVESDVNKNLPPPTPPKVNKDEDTQITDSELNRIDNLFQDIYEGHNKTMATETNSNLLAYKCHSTASRSNTQKIEFVCSLLKPEVKVG